MAAPFPSPTSKWQSETYPSLSPSRSELSAKGKTVVVTGGGTGIGRETARAFAEAGAARIALLGRREQPLAENKAYIEDKFPRSEVFIASTDITNQQQVDNAFAKFAANGKINVLVSNAALTGPHESVDDVDTKKFLDSVHQNLQGSLYIAQAFVRHAASDAVVIDVNSSAAHLNFAPKFAAYSVAKLAVCRMWDSFSCGNPEMAVFHTQPGVVDTAMNREAGGIAAVGFEDHVSLPATFNVWLASPEARFLKNKFLWTNWDVDELKARAEEIGSSTFLNVGLNGWPFQDKDWKLELKNDKWLK